jgi:hypothetical protein
VAYQGAIPPTDPASLGYLEWAYDPAAAGTVSVATAGLLQLTRVQIRKPRTVTNVHVHVGVAGSGFTSGQNFAGLWSSAGTLLAITADQSTPWATAGEQVMALASTQAVSVGYVYVGWWTRASSRPQMSGVAVGAGAWNAGTSGSALRFATADSGLTTSGTAPSSLGAKTAASIPYWAALS